MRQWCIGPPVTESRWGPFCFPHHWTPESCLENPAAQPRLGRPVTRWSGFDIPWRAVLAVVSWFAIVTVYSREASCSRSFRCGCTPIHPFVNTPAHKQSLRPGGPDTEDAFRPSRGREGRLIQTYARLAGRVHGSVQAGLAPRGSSRPVGGRSMQLQPPLPSCSSRFVSRLPTCLRCCSQLMRLSSDVAWEDHPCDTAHDASPCARCSSPADASRPPGRSSTRDAS